MYHDVLLISITMFYTHLILYFQLPGSCICREGFAGQNCDQCAIGYHSFPRCEKCTCSVEGSLDPTMCEGNCVCKVG